jgi:hypothetical protein
VSGDDEDNRSNDDAKNRKIGVDTAVEGSGVWIDFGRHGKSEFKGYKVTLLKRFHGHVVRSLVVL